VCVCVSVCVGGEKGFMGWGLVLRFDGDGDVMGAAMDGSEWRSL